MEPAPPAQIGFTERGNQIQLNWPADHAGWQLQAQTNSLATGLDTNWINLTGSDHEPGAGAAGRDKPPIAVAPELC